MRFIALLILSSISLTAAPYVLYDGAVQGSAASLSPRLFYFALGTETYLPGDQATNFDTTFDNSFQGGYTGVSAPDFPTLDRVIGYTVSFSLEILSESFTNSQRAGFSVIVVSSDVGAGVPSSVEIGFQANRVFAQADTPLFGAPSAAESTFNPVGVGYVDYDLQVLGGGFNLFANGSSILSGSLQDYTAFGGFPDPYETPNFVFFGDDTTSAQADINFRSAAIEVNQTPEPATWLLSGLGLAALALKRRG